MGDVNPRLLESETRDYVDSGVLLNAPYISVLRPERHVDLIITLDFSKDQMKVYGLAHTTFVTPFFMHVSII